MTQFKTFEVKIDHACQLRLLRWQCNKKWAWHKTSRYMKEYAYQLGNTSSRGSLKSSNVELG